MTESFVEINGSYYRYRYDPATKKMRYLGPVGLAGELTEEEFLKEIQGMDARLQAATEDLSQARTTGGVLISGTRMGPVQLKYNEGNYILNTLGNPYEKPRVLAKGTANMVKPKLMDLYVEEER
jgi:hypothetical protein